MRRAIPIALAAALDAGCGPALPAASPLPRDLMRDLAGARIQPAASADVARVGDLVSDGVSAPVLFLASPARLTWSMRFTERADLDASVALISSTTPDGVTVRIGISNDRAYEELRALPVTAIHDGSNRAWQPIRVDLSSYSGWKWSLFYRPSRITWNVIVNVHAAPGGTVALRTLSVVPH